MVTKNAWGQLAELYPSFTILEGKAVPGVQPNEPPHEAELQELRDAVEANTYGDKRHLEMLFRETIWKHENRPSAERRDRNNDFYRKYNNSENEGFENNPLFTYGLIADTLTLWSSHLYQNGKELGACLCRRFYGIVRLADPPRIALTTYRIMGDNKLNGTIPSELGKLRNLTIL